MPTIITRGAASAQGFGFAGNTAAAPGSQSYTTPGTYTWVAPAGVTKVSVVAVGGGQGAGGISNYAGGGGGLGYKNNITVVPGNSYTVVVGTGGISAASSCSPPTCGTSSYFCNTTLVRGIAPTGTSGVGGGYVGDGGGNGGHGYQNGGGGAGGYSGAGGKGANAGGGTQGTAGAGGGGGGGSTNRYCCFPSCCSGYLVVGGGGGGGGVGLFGQGSNGTYTTGNFSCSTSTTTAGGGGGSCGGNGATGTGTANYNSSNTGAPGGG